MDSNILVIARLPTLSTYCSNFNSAFPCLTEVGAITDTPLSFVSISSLSIHCFSSTHSLTSHHIWFFLTRSDQLNLSLLLLLVTLSCTQAFITFSQTTKFHMFFPYDGIILKCSCLLRIPSLFLHLFSDVFLHS